MTTARAKQREVILNLLGDTLYKLPKPQGEDSSVLESSKVCKSHLVWQCPYKMLEGSRDVGICHKLHLERYKIMYQSGPPCKEFELEHLNQLKACLEACDSKIKVSNAKYQVNEEDEEGAVKLDVQMGIIGEEIDALLANGDILMALEKSGEVEKSERPHSNRHEDVPTQACSTCGAILSKLDNDRRLADHFMGKIHLAYVQIRERLGVMEAKYKDEQ